MALRHIARAHLPTEWAEFTVHAFTDAADDNADHLALTLGELGQENEPLLGRIHSSCATGDALFSLRCDCGAQLQYAMQKIAEAGCGVLLYMAQEGRNIGLSNKILSYQLQDDGADTVEANLQMGFAEDQRNYTPCAEILRYLGIRRLRLMTNNPQKISALESLGIEVTERVAVQVGNNPHNQHYLATKADKLGHII